MRKSIAIAIICGLAMLVAADQTVFGQAGSTGGTIGKTDKSLSGGENSKPRLGRCEVAQPQGVAINLTGKWSCNDGGTYTIRQSGTKISWEGVSGDGGSSWTHTFNGVIQNNIIGGKFFDHPPGSIRQSGELKIRIVDANRLEKLEASVPFGGSVWTRRSRP